MTANPVPRPSRPSPARQLPGESRLAWAAMLCACVLAGCGGGEQTASSAKGSGYAMLPLPTEASTTATADAAPPIARAHRAAWAATDTPQSSPSQHADQAPQDSNPGLDKGDSREPGEPTVRQTGQGSSLGALELARGDALAQPGVPQALRGLPNDSDNCFVNATVQLLAHFPALREVALANLRHGGRTDQADAMAALFTAYAQGTDLEVRDHHAALLTSLRGLPNFPAAGEHGSVLELWANAPDGASLGLQLPALAVVEFNQMVQGYQDHERVFTMGVPQVGHVATGGPVSYEWLPHAGQLAAMVYNSGGHYIAFVRHQDRWWSLNDSQVQAVDLPHLQGLPIGEGRGFELVIYADEPLGPLLHAGQGVGAGLQQALSSGVAIEGTLRTPPRMPGNTTGRPVERQSRPDPLRQSNIHPLPFARGNLDSIAWRLRFDGTDWGRPTQQPVAVPQIEQPSPLRRANAVQIQQAGERQDSADEGPYNMHQPPGSGAGRNSVAGPGRNQVAGTVADAMPIPGEIHIPGNGSAMSSDPGMEAFYAALVEANSRYSQGGLHSRPGNQRGPSTQDTTSRGPDGEDSSDPS